jgi:hypothetical protein
MHSFLTIREFVLHLILDRLLLIMDHSAPNYGPLFFHEQIHDKMNPEKWSSDVKT